MCLCGVLGSTSSNLPEGVLVQARKFFEIGLSRLIEGGLSRAKAIQLIATLEGAMMLANVLSETSTFDEATADLR
jgi:TetR/AcrR family transcriptional repressor of nem operon